MARAQRQTRDDFSTPVKEQIARRVGYLCSRCYRSTVGPTTDPHRSSNVGIAAHIAAAASGGPRFNTNMTSEERSAAPNGIWCCGPCAKRIDDDPLRFTVPILLELRAAAERAADQRLEVTQRHEEELINAEALSRTAALAILREWRATYHVEGDHLVELELTERRYDRADAPATWTVPTLVAGLKERRALVVRGRPGAGKTMTLLETAGTLAADAAAPVPLVVAASAWAATGQDLAGYLENLLAGHGVDRATVPLLLRVGRLAVLMNGWNETAEADLVRAERLLKDFTVNFPGHPLLVTTRLTESRPALRGETVLDVRLLSRAKKIEVIRGANLREPEALIAQVTGSSVLDQVTDTPLFLSVAIRLARQGIALPETRAGLLQRCVEEMETRDDHRTALHAAPCYGFHRTYLAEIAIAMTRRAQTTLTVPEVQRVLADCNVQLREAGHLSAPGASPAIADSLVRHHVLVLSPSGDGRYSFVHQQFQERFTADWLVARIRELAAENSAASILRIQQEILNYPQWSEALAFAMEELAGEPDTAAAAVRWMMSVDLVAAAELAGAGGPRVWDRARSDLSPALRRWHAREGEPHQACALAAMIATGAPDFADVLWPMMAGDDEQEFFRALRAYPVFRISCLGPDWEAQLGRLTERRQEVFLGEMARQSGREELEFARRLATSGASPLLKNAAIELLAYRRRSGEAVELARSEAFGGWSLETYRLFSEIPRALVGPLVPRLLDEFAAARDFSLRHTILSLLRAQNHERWLELAKQEIAAAAAARREISPLVGGADATNRRAALASVVASYAEMIATTAPDWIEAWLVAHEARDLLWERPLNERIPQFGGESLRALTEMELAAPPANFRSSERIRVLGSSGSARVGAVVLEGFLHPGAADPFDRRDLLRQLPAVALLGPFAARAEAAATFEERVRLLDALEHVSEVRGAATVAQRDILRRVIGQVSEAIPEDYENAAGLRATLAALLGKIGVPEDVAAIEALIARENARWDEIRREAAEVRQEGRVRRIGQNRTGYSNYYVGALAALPCPESEAALVRLLALPNWLGEASRGLIWLSHTEGLLPERPSAFDRQIGIPVVTPFSPGPAVRRRSEAIHAAIVAHMAAGAPVRPFLPPDIVGAAGALAVFNDARAVELLLGVCNEHCGWTVVESLHLMSVRGAVLPGRRILRALEPFIAAGEGTPMNSGHDPWHGVVKAFAILLASDDPGAAVERMRQLPSVRMRNYYARDIFAVLAVCPKPEAGDYLVELSRSTAPDSGGDPELIDALATSKHPVCRARLLELAVIPGAQRAAESFRRAFVRAAEEDPAFGRTLQELLQRFGERERLVFISSMHRLESEAVMLALLELADLRPAADTLRHMVRGVALAEVPAKARGVHHLVPRAANEVRRKLAALLRADVPETRAIAVLLLAKFQEERLHYGQPLDEPLHPDATLIAGLRGPWGLTA